MDHMRKHCFQYKPRQVEKDTEEKETRGTILGNNKDMVYCREAEVRKWMGIKPKMREMNKTCISKEKLTLVQHTSRTVKDAPSPNSKQTN